MKEEKLQQIQQKYTGSHRFDIGTAQTIGKRTYMEDTVMIRGALFDDVDYIAVFDGHNGKDAAIKCMETMHTLIEKDLILSDEYDDHLINVFERMHDIVCEATPSGTTASLVILRNDDIITAHCGDSPIYFLINNELKRIGKGHSPADEDEAEKIKNNGGTVSQDAGGYYRVNGQIAVSRSIGDRALHPPLLCIPDIELHSMDDVRAIIVASDGIDLVPLTYMKEVLNTSFGVDIKAQCIRNKAIEKQSKDNISVVVVHFDRIE